MRQQITGGATESPRIVIAHDYLTQRGGAERVVLDMTRAFPSADIVTAIFNPLSTYPEFSRLNVSTSPLSRVAAFRADPRLALPLLPFAWSSRRPLSADVVICSSSGWSHALPVTPGTKKIVYCHNPARWLYQAEDYLLNQQVATQLTLRAISPLLRQWDRKAAETADVYIANSSSVAERIYRAYGRRAEVIFPPVGVDADAEQSPIRGISKGYFLTVGRQRAYKGTDLLVEAFRQIPDQRLVVVGSSEQMEVPPNIHYTGFVSDSELRWLYAHARSLISVSREDFGLTPIEANCFGVPALLLRAGGFLDSTDEGVSGSFINAPDVDEIVQAVRSFRSDWDAKAIKRHAEKFSLENFEIQMLKHMKTST